MNYYRLLDDVSFPRRWHLKGLVGIDGSQFVRPPMVPMNSTLRDQTYEVEVQTEGHMMDYSTTSFRSVPIVSFNVVKALSGLDGITAFPVRIRGAVQKQSYYILHFWDEVECVDESLSMFEKFQPDDPIRPDLAGQYSGFFKLVINPHRALGKDAFRLVGSGAEVIVSEKFKDLFEQHKLTGAIFENVS
ncbi:hypothetical protein CQ052_21915 [Ochrobactrum sp. MYb15]|nr:hypothetical protein CQZ90_21315 [Ochrobactrum sp. MYb19]PRA60760.1 hypothetical protein CQ053_20920 [Ochrobactrum sp. MYb18]PRA73497.1 hypothetical protein CQ049_20740 [Brucella thiophenivorans]PRA85119.1 hypothetical protein CQ051_21325 [Ochrobactrum sp. MYb14]PRA95019.1 hypothetical protein CQ052_21915 [Ochrobactrum sp. MYb15]